ncbi:MAG: cell division protein FtsL [Raoultibacter sp.]|jgi:cell division protein FtsL
MASAAPAYRQPERAPQQSPRIRVVPGRGTPQAPDTLPSSVITLAKLFAVILVVFALLAFLRIGMASATVTTAVAADEISAEIEGLRSQGSNLEVAESNLSNPTYIKSEAAKLSMVAPGETAVITLPQDVVTTDASGNLSLAASLKAAAQV